MTFVTGLPSASFCMRSRVSLSHSSGFSGSALQIERSTTSILGKMPRRDLARVVLAVPWPPQMPTPPKEGSMQAKRKASFTSSSPMIRYMGTALRAALESLELASVESTGTSIAVAQRWTADTLFRCCLEWRLAAPTVPTKAAAAAAAAKPASSSSSSSWFMGCGCGLSGSYARQWSVNSQRTKAKSHRNCVNSCRTPAKLTPFAICTMLSSSARPAGENPGNILWNCVKA
mmetsp:Transcript_51327/g.147365  ORF Transcript_51327/g.147365 Transcript_51327/m.147365 type:complete len:231 (+) Transcript_51327:1933-2625(+)